MSFMWHESGGRYRKRMAERRRRIAIVIIFLMALGAACYWRGREDVIASELAYKEQYQKLQKEREGLDQTITQLRSEVQSAQVRYQQLDQKFKTEVPQGEFKMLTDLVKKQLQGGIKAERLSFVIDSARPPRNCGEPQLKRFVMKTPVYSGPQGAVSFGNGVVTVAGEGAASVNPSGKAEAWYDPGKPVKIIFTEIGGKQTVKEGLLPVQHSLVVGNKEYRFTVAAGERSFISVTSDSCDYP
jgi:cell division protein FtsB